jgi:flagellar secretion chaperone FliS
VTTVMTRGVEAYRRTEAQSASPMQLVVMLYDGAVRFLNEARDADVRGDLRARAEALTRVSAIVAECHVSLDLERGGTVALELDRLYSYISARLIDITVNRDASAIPEVLTLMSTLRDAWAEAAVQPLALTATRPNAPAGASAAR